VLSSTTKFLALSLTGALGRFFSDLSATVPHGRPVEEVGQQVQEVLARHHVTVAGLGAADLDPVP
jgi:hypothetical protein